MVTAKEPHAYFITGDQAIIKDEFLEALKKKLLDPGSVELNFSSFSGKDNTIDEMLTAAKTAPFLGKRRIILIRDVDKLNSSSKTSLLLFLKNPKESTCLVLESLKPPSANGFLSDVSRRCTVVRAQTPQYGGLNRWILERTSFYNKSITKDAVELLKEASRDDLDLLSKELDKIISFIGDSLEITRADVEQVAGRSLKEDVFSLVNYINRRDTSGALRLCKRLIVQGKKAHEIIGLMGWNFRKILSKRSTIDFGSKELKRSLRLLFEADREIKTGRGKPEFVLDILISKLCAI